jgi:LacI family sucrose operon transcriptional repressor
MATLKDVAEKAGVTVTTVSRMINNRGYMSEKTRNNILAAMKELNYQPNEIARSLSLKRSNFIGLIVPSTKNMFFGKIIQGIEQHLSERGYRLLLCNSNLEEAKEAEYFNMLNANKVAGVIIASHTENLEEKISSEAPILTLDRIISETIPYICADNYQGGVLATEHLIENGCQKLAYISGSSHLPMDANKRYLALRDVCEKYGIPHVVLDATEEQFQLMRYDSIVDTLLNKHGDVDGVFTSNDIIAAHIIHRCNEKKIRIPDDLKVIGYDDVDICLFTNPQITTIRQPYEEICKLAAENMIAMIEKKPFQSKLNLPVRLIRRGSV